MLIAKYKIFVMFTEFNDAGCKQIAFRCLYDSQIDCAGYLTTVCVGALTNVCFITCIFRYVFVVMQACTIKRSQGSRFAIEFINIQFCTRK